MCGKNPEGTAEERVIKGSPPRVREKRSIKTVERKKDRITPACAGKTATPTKNQGRDGDHPRVCGKNQPFGKLRHLDTGSPPRVREKQVKSQLEHYQSGITPACAGKTSNYRWHARLNWDHPRVCGKNVPRPVVAFGMSGSPPRVREKRWNSN